MEKYKFLLLIFQSSRLPSKYVLLIFEQWIPCSNSLAWQWWCFPLLCFLCFPHFLTMNSNSPAWQWWCAGQFLCLPNPYAVLENKSVLGNCKFWYFFLLFIMTSKYSGSRTSLPKNATFRPPRASDKTLTYSIDCAVCTHTHWYKFYKKYLTMDCIWENRNVEKSPKDEELIVPNWNCWSWLVGNNKRICCSANKWRRFAEKEFFRKKLISCLSLERKESLKANAVQLCC